MSETPRQRSKHARTPDARSRILDALRTGASYDVAAHLGGIADSTLSEWRKDDADFAVDCAKARAEMQVAMLAVIHRAAVTDRTWQAAAWKLERIFPEQFGRRFQPLAMVIEDAKEDSPGKVYRVVFQRPEAPNIAESGAS